MLELKQYAISVIFLYIQLYTVTLFQISMTSPTSLPLCLTIFPLPQSHTSPAAGVFVGLGVDVVLPLFEVLVFDDLEVEVGVTDVGLGVVTVVAGERGVAIALAMGSGQSPTRSGTAFVPLLIETRFVPQEAALAKWMFWLSWS